MKLHIGLYIVRAEMLEEGQIDTDETDGAGGLSLESKDSERYTKQSE